MNAATRHDTLTAPGVQGGAVARVHGGTDAQGAARYDFSTNSNAMGPCPQALQAVAQADATRYPDASYSALKSALAALHGVEAWRIVLAGSASEFIFRITALAARSGVRQVWLPSPSYGDYAQAARAWALGVTADPTQAGLLWGCDPSSPTGQSHLAWARHAASDLPALQAGLAVLDCAYTPLRLQGSAALPEAVQRQCWALFSPNKSLGLTGVRAAYALAPAHARGCADALEALAPSWPVGAHGEAMLQAWASDAVQDWVRQSRVPLAAYRGQLQTLLQSLGWECLPSDTHYFCARPPQPLTAPQVAQLRSAGIKLRDTTSMGLPGWFRLSAQRPDACAALGEALRQLTWKQETTQ